MGIKLQFPSRQHAGLQLKRGQFNINVSGFEVINSEKWVLRLVIKVNTRREVCQILQNEMFSCHTDCTLAKTHSLGEKSRSTCILLDVSFRFVTRIPQQNVATCKLSTISRVTKTDRLRVRIFATAFSHEDHIPTFSSTMSNFILFRVCFSSTPFCLYFAVYLSCFNSRPL